MARSSRGLRSGGQLIGAEHVLAVEIQHPVGVVDGVEIALAEVWSDCHCSEVIRAVDGQPVHCAADDCACGAAEQESSTCQLMTSANGVGLVDEYDVVQIRLVEHGGTDA